MWSHAPSGLREGYFLTLRHGNDFKNIKTVELNVGDR